MQKPSLDKVNLNKNLNKIDTLVRHLALVNQIATSGYWLSTDELIMVLDVDPQVVSSFHPQAFPWRNFTVVPVATHGNNKFWQIKADVNSAIAPPVSVPAIAPTYSEGQIIAAEYAWVENFLTVAQHDRLLNYVTSQQAKFQPSVNTGNEYRQ